MEENMNRHPRPRRNVERVEQTPENTAKAADNTSGAADKAQSVAAAKPASTAQNQQAAPAQRPVPAKRPSDATTARQSASQSAAKSAQHASQSTAKPAQPASQSVAKPVQRVAAQPAVKAAQQSAASNAEVKKPAVKPVAKPVASPVAKPQNAVSATPSDADNDSEKTRLTDVQPKAKLKTPVRKAVDDEGEGGTLGGVFKALVYMTAVIVVGIVSAYFIIQFGNDVFAFVKSDEVVEVVIPEDATVADIAEILGDGGVIKYPFLFKLYASLSGEETVDENGNSVFIPGTYEVSPMNNYMQLLSCFQARAKVRDVVWVTFPEGSTVDEMITVLVDDYGIASREEFKSAINDYDYELDFLDGIDSLEGRYYRLEGYLFPDTYQFYTDSTAETVVYKMLKNFETKLGYLSYGDETYKDRLEELGMTLDEVVTLASMIEEEVKYPIDYDQVSSVFHNRLKDPANYPTLGSDATTIYAITMETGERPQTLGAEELAFDSPYNTRKSKGLPPGAIANPGFEALYSAFYPADTKYYYFVADSYGYNLYARTEAGHEKNKASIKD